MSIHFSTGKDTWATPWDVVGPLDATHQFTIDGAADAANRQCARYWGPGGEHEDFLTTTAADWQDQRIWLNPPYSRGAQSAFLEHAVAMVLVTNARCVCLLPARTDTKRYHRFVWEAARERPYPWVRSLTFVQGRITFVGAEAGAPFPSMIVTLEYPYGNI